MILYATICFLCRFEAMLRWAKHQVKSKTYPNRVDAKIEFRCCMDRLTRDLKLYRISPLDLIKVMSHFFSLTLTFCCTFLALGQWQNSYFTDGKLKVNLLLLVHSSRYRCRWYRTCSETNYGELTFFPPNR